MTRTGLILLATGALSLLAQDSRFESRSRLVLVPVTIADAQGNHVDGLEAPDFVVLDNGIPQHATVDTIGTGVAPIALVIAVQSSNLSAAVIEKIQKIPSMIQPLITGERGCAALMSFSGRINWLQECTNDADALQRGFHRLHPAIDKDGHMLDAAQAAIARLNERPDSRRILLLISESRDRGSLMKLQAVTIAAQTAGVTVYAATYSAFVTAFTSNTPVPRTRRSVEGAVMNPEGTVDGMPGSHADPKLTSPDDSLDAVAGIGEIMRLGKTDTTQALTTATGGITLPFTRQKGLEMALEKLGAELHTQYVVSFAPSSATPGYHAIAVKVNRPGEYRLRARPGYWNAAALP